MFFYFHDFPNFTKILAPPAATLGSLRLLRQNGHASPHGQIAYHEQRVTPQEFIGKWQAANLSERSACQQHFLDRCDLLGESTTAARKLDRLRTAWLNPPEWTREEILEFPGSVDGPWARYVVGPAGPAGPEAPNASPSHSASRGKPASTQTQVPPRPSGPTATVRYPRLVPRDEACAKELKRRTLTNLYNQRPAWLDLAHKKLDEAVFAAYGWPTSLTDDELLARLLALNLERTSSSEA